MENEIEAIRERHEAEIREPNKWTFNRAEAAHADRATLLHLLSEERARRVEMEGALKLVIYQAVLTPSDARFCSDVAKKALNLENNNG